MKKIILSMLFFALSSHAAEPTRVHEQAKDENTVNIHEMWTLGAAYLKGPTNVDGSSFSIGTPAFWSNYSTVDGVTNLEAKYQLNAFLNWERLYIKNTITDSSGNFEEEACNLFSLNTRGSLLFNNQNVGFIELGYGLISGVDRFTKNDVDGLILGFGTTAGIATIKLNHFITSDVAEKLAAEPNIFEGTYLSVGFNFGLNRGQRK